MLKCIACLHDFCISRRSECFYSDSIVDDWANETDQNGVSFNTGRGDFISSKFKQRLLRIADEPQRPSEPEQRAYRSTGSRLSLYRLL